MTDVDWFELWRGERLFLGLPATVAIFKSEVRRVLRLMPTGPGPRTARILRACEEAYRDAAAQSDARFHQDL